MADPLKALLVGCGGMGNNWARILKPRQDIDLVGVVDIEPAASERLAANVGLDRPRFVNFETALETLHPDVVLDTSIPETRLHIAGTSLSFGCHVLCEKPLSLSMADARELVALSHEYGRTLAVMQNRRYLNGSHQVRDLLEQRLIGQVGFVCADFFIGAHFEGFRTSMPNPLLTDMTIHTFDQARFMTGLEAESVYCHEFNTPGSWYQGNASAFCLFDMSSKVPFCYRGSWTAEGANTTWESSWRIVGERGTIVWDGQEAAYAEVVDSDAGFIRHTRKITSAVEPLASTGHAGCLADMVRALHEGRQPGTVADDNIKSLAMSLGSVASAVKGERIEIEDLEG